MEVAGYRIGLDVGATKVAAGAVTDTGEILLWRCVDSRRGSLDEMVGLMIACIEWVIDEHSAGRPLSIGVGLRGYADLNNGIWLNTLMIPNFAPVALAGLLQKRFSIPVYVDNDVHAATVAELKIGVGKKYRDFVYLNIGTGIATGIVANGMLVRGGSNFAGEFGHVIVEPDGERCYCGQHGCLEPIASGGGLICEVRSLLPKYPTSLLVDADARGMLHSHSIFIAYDQGDALAIQVTDRALTALIKGIICLLNLLNPQAIVLGGGVVADGWLLHRLKDRLDRVECQLPSCRLKALEMSILGAKTVGTLGAALLAIPFTSNGGSDEPDSL